MIKLSCYENKMDCYIYKKFYVSLMVTTKQKAIIYSQKIEKEIKAYHYGKSSILKGRQQERKQGIKELQKQPGNSKMVLVSPYLSISTLIVNGLNF